MLPSFRLIAVTFCCGFIVVFAGLRLAASLNDVHQGLPVMAAHAAPVDHAGIADREARRGRAVPVMYDMRFAVSTRGADLVRVPPTVSSIGVAASDVPLDPAAERGRSEAVNAAADADAAGHGRSAAGSRSAGESRAGRRSTIRSRAGAGSTATLRTPGRRNTPAVRRRQRRRLRRQPSPQPTSEQPPRAEPAPPSKSAPQPDAAADRAGHRRHRSRCRARPGPLPQLRSSATKAH